MRRRVQLIWNHKPALFAEQHLNLSWTSVLTLQRWQTGQESVAFAADWYSHLLAVFPETWTHFNPFRRALLSQAAPGCAQEAQQRFHWSSVPTARECSGLFAAPTWEDIKENYPNVLSLQHEAQASWWHRGVTACLTSSFFIYRWTFPQHLCDCIFIFSFTHEQPLNMHRIFKSWLTVCPGNLHKTFISAFSTAESYEQ